MGTTSFACWELWSSAVEHASGMARDHQVFIGRDDPDRYLGARLGEARSSSGVGCLVEFNAYPTSVATDARTDGSCIFTDAASENQGIEATQGGDQRTQFPPYAIDEEIHRFSRGGRVACQQGPHVAGQCRDAEQSGFLVDQVFDGLGFHPLVLKEIKNDAGIERAGARSHRKAVDGRKPHGAGKASPVVDGAHAGAVAEMGDDELAVYAVRRDLRQRRDDVFVRKTMKAVTAHTLFLERARQGKSTGHLDLPL